MAQKQITIFYPHTFISATLFFTNISAICIVYAWLNGDSYLYYLFKRKKNTVILNVFVSIFTSFHLIVFKEATLYAMV